MTTRRWVSLALLATLIVGVFVLVPRLRSDARADDPKAAMAGAENRPVPVATFPVEVRDVPVVLEALGNAAALQSATLKSVIDGRLEKVDFTEGQAVKKGDVLAEIDARPYAIQLRQYEASIARDKATLENGKISLERTMSLFKEDLVPRQQLDDQRSQVSQLEAGVHVSEAQASSARLMIEYAKVRAPFDGVVGVRQVDPGNLVHPSDANGIVVITQIDPIAVFLTLPQDDLPRVSRELALHPLDVQAFSRDGATKLGEGKITVIDNEVNAQTATIKLKAVLDNHDHALWPNLFVKVKIQLSTRKGVTVVPSAVVQRGPQGTFAYVVDAEQKANIRPIEVDSIEGDSAIIKSGLAAGDIVVVEGQGQIRPGGKVQPKAPGKPGGGGTPPPAGSQDIKTDKKKRGGSGP